MIYNLTIDKVNKNLIKNQFDGWFGLWCLMPLSTISQLYHGHPSFIGGGNQSTQRKPLTCRKSLTNFIT
jgi:hypothetical protein